MNLLSNFADAFPNFLSLFTEGELGDYIIRFYDDDGVADYNVILGFTELPNKDILLHLIDAEVYNTWEEIFEGAKEHGVHFELLSRMITKHGFDILTSDQIEDEDEDKEELLDE